MQLPGRTTQIRLRDVGILKQYSENYYRLVHLNSVRAAGFEPVRPLDKPPPVRGAVNDEKLQNSLSRSRSRVFELAMCNPWDYFCTFTLNPEKHDRYDLNASYRQLAKWVNNYGFRQHLSLSYLLVPEPHSDGAWHFHGLLHGLPLSHLTLFTCDQHIPSRIKAMLASGRMIYNWPAYAAAFGFVTVEAIQNADACAAYMTKYITKELAHSSIELNHHVYYASHGLQRATEFYRGTIFREITDPDFENDYVHVKHYDNPDEPLSHFLELEEHYGKDSIDG